MRNIMTTEAVVRHVAKEPHPFHKECDKGKYGDVSVCYIGRDHYVLNKRASGRKKDLADLEALGE
jgi:hypothetical protein